VNLFCEVSRIHARLVSNPDQQQPLRHFIIIPFTPLPWSITNHEGKTELTLDQSPPTGLYFSSGEARISADTGSADHLHETREGPCPPGWRPSFFSSLADAPQPGPILYKPPASKLRISTLSGPSISKYVSPSYCIARPVPEHRAGEGLAYFQPASRSGPWHWASFRARSPDSAEPL